MTCHMVHRKVLSKAVPDLCGPWSAGSNVKMKYKQGPFHQTNNTINFILPVLIVTHYLRNSTGRLEYFRAIQYIIHIDTVYCFQKKSYITFHLTLCSLYDCLWIVWLVIWQPYMATLYYLSWVSNITMLIRFFGVCSSTAKMYKYFQHLIWFFFTKEIFSFVLQQKMNELDSLRQEAETLKNAIRVSLRGFSIFE